MKKMLITGVNGFIGSAAKKFFNKTYNVYGLDMFGNANERTYIMNMSCDSIKDIILKIDPDIILHAAGGANVLNSVENPKEDFENSVQAFYSLLESVRAVCKGCTVVFLSSAAVYGNAKKLPITETSELRPISPYGLHKVICENIVKYYRNVYDMDIRVLRIFSVYGPGLRKQIMWDMFQKYISHGKIELCGTGDEARDFIYIGDLLQSIDIVLNADKKREQYIYNVANGEAITIQKVSHIFSNLICGKDIVVFNNMERSGDPDVWMADISKIIDLGYYRKMPLEQGIKCYIEWARKEV